MAAKKKKTATKKKTAPAKKPAPKKKPAPAKKPAPKKKAAPAKKAAAPAKKAAAPAKKAAAPAKKAAAPAKKAPAKASEGPWRRTRYDDGSYGLFFSVDDFFDMGAMEIFEKGGAYGNGYGWESVIAPALEKAHPKLADAIEYDCEADMFVARAADEAHLDALAAVIAAITASPAALARAVAARDPERD